MSDVDERPQPKLRWFQISLRTLLALVLGFGAGMAVNYPFRLGQSDLPNPANIRRGDSLLVEWRISGEAKWTAHTGIVLADGTVRLRELGGVQAAGMSLDQLSENLRSRYTEYLDDVVYKRLGLKAEVFVDFALPSRKE